MADWWKDAVVYQIYPRSFQDSNADGIGDLQGIIRRLDYIQALGANVIWLCPVYASPNADNGYDISDYQAIHPDFGTMDDFHQLLDQVHRRNMRLIMDLVVNHTSDEHAWFQQGRQSRENPYHDFYIWKSADTSPPNAWTSWFSGSAWEKNEETDEYYLHIFSKKQPDLNWTNPEVRQSVYSMMRWWLDQGIDGFRMDVISLISKPDVWPCNSDSDLSPYCVNGPHVHEYLQEMNREVLSKYDIMTVGECPNITPAEAKKYAGLQQHELNMVFQFEHTNLTDGPYGKWNNQRVNLPALKAVFARWQEGLRDASWNCLFWSNHDQPRAVSKFGNDAPQWRVLSAKMLCTCMYLMQGTPYIYQGEELGMTNAGFTMLEDYRDIETLNAYNDLVSNGKLTPEVMLHYLSLSSRDNARTPMQWDSSSNSGFTEGTPWIQIAKNYSKINAGAEQNDPDSVYSFYQKILLFRKCNHIIRDGSFNLLWPEHESIFAYSRSLENQAIYVFCNFSDRESRLPSLPFDSNAKVIISNYSSSPLHQVLRPYEAIVICQELTP